MRMSYWNGRWLHKDEISVHVNITLCIQNQSMNWHLKLGRLLWDIFISRRYFVICLSAEFHMPTSSGLLAVAIKPNGKEHICPAPIWLLYVTQKHNCNVCRIFSIICYSTSFRNLEQSSATVFPASRIRVSAMFLLIAGNSKSRLVISYNGISCIWKSLNKETSTYIHTHIHIKSTVVSRAYFFPF